MGHSSAKEQQLDDHYFGSIPSRVTAFMKDLEFEAYKLGIPLKTRHNEVAPNQFELAPIYEECNLANDHNQLIMDLMKRIALKHGFNVLFHEKPFQSVNGSGKHNNWSLTTNTGVNLFSPGKNPRTNMVFLTFLVNVVMMVYKNQDLIRASIMSATNNRRLGANEAPPAILSVFLGSSLTHTLERLEKEVSNSKMTPEEKTALKFGIGRIPEILIDNTDRNRTSPFAFTGNRFEFRAAGSSSNCAASMIVLNAAMAHQLNDFKKKVDLRIEKGEAKEEAIFRELKEMIKESKSICFEGDGYSKGWEMEAQKRHLSNIHCVPEALLKYESEYAQEVLIGEGIFTKAELSSRVDVEMEKYVKKIQIESRVLGDLTINHIIPSSVAYQNVLLDNVVKMKQVFEPQQYEGLSRRRRELIVEIQERIDGLKDLVEAMTEQRKYSNNLSTIREKAFSYSTNVDPYLDQIRDHIDHLEMTIDNELYPFPKYRELLFTK